MPAPDEILPFHRSRGERARMQREIKQAMGTSREGAQSPRTILRAAQTMAQLVEWSTGGELTLALVPRSRAGAIGGTIRAERRAAWREAIDRASSDPTL